MKERVAMLTIEHLDHPVLRVTGLAGMMAFYTNRLGSLVEKVRQDLACAGGGD